MAAARKARRAGDGEVEATTAGTFLGVTRSAKGMSWRERLSPSDHNTAAAISQRHGLPDLLGRMLAARGITIDTAAVFLDPTIRALMPDPDTLRDMDVAAKRLADAPSTS
jgi:single-stranded-DNA-specific exonuclease